MTTTSLQARLLTALEILLDRIHESVSKTDIIIFVIGSTGAGKSTFINKAISDDVMAVNDTLSSCGEDVKTIRCTSPWNPSGRSVIFAEIPAFNHSDPMIQKKIPDLIKRWLSKTHCTDGTIESGIIYLHSMASPRLNEDFKKHLDPFVKLCHDCGHRPSSALLVSTMWSHDESEEDVYGKTKELEERFRKIAISSMHAIPYSVRFDANRVSARNAIDLLMLDIRQDASRTRDTITHFIPAPFLPLTLSESGVSFDF